MYIILALISMFLSAIQEIFGKQVSNQKIKSETIFINNYLYLGIFKVILIIVTVGQAFVFRPLMLLLLMPNIILSALISYLYLKAVKKLPISVVVPIYLLYYPISMVFSIGLLKETVTFIQLIAMAVIFILVLVLSISTSKNRLNDGINQEHFEESNKRFGLHLGSISKGITYIVSAGLLNGIVVLLDKNAFNCGLTINENLLFGGIGNIIIAFMLYSITKKSFSRKGLKYLYVLTPRMLVVASLKFLSGIAYVAAMKLGNATIVVPITASSILFIEILSAIFLNEKLKKFDYLCIILFMVSIAVLIL